MPNGKPANTPCVNLDRASLRCRIWNTSEYPAFCRRFEADISTCGNDKTEAVLRLQEMNVATEPDLGI